MKLKNLFYFILPIFLIGCVSDGYVRTTVFIEPEPIYASPSIFYFEYYPFYHSHHHYFHHNYRPNIIVRPKIPRIDAPKFDSRRKFPKIPNPPILPKQPNLPFKNAPKVK